MAARADKDTASHLLNYPRAGKHGVAKWVPSLRLLGVGVLGGFLLLIGLFTLGYVSTTIPEPNAAAAGQTSTVYYDDGTTVIGTFKSEDRRIVGIDDISQNMQQAAIAAEDNSFYENRGISVKGLTRAVFGVLTDNYAGGGSTITQQYVKNYYLSNERTLERKVREMFLAIKIDQEKSKDQIMADYLNTIFLGRQSYGVEVAARNYFGKSAKDLSVEESALMAAIIQRPNLADPYENPELLEDRFHYVLNNMAENGYITEEDAQNAQMPEVKPERKENERLGQTGYLMDAVKKELLANGLTEDQINRGGYTIVSTFNRDRMADSLEAVDTLPKLKEGMHVGLTSVDPSTGEVKAIYGGPNYFDQMLNDSTQQTAQAGSTFKPFALVAGLEAGYRLNDTFRGSQTTYPNDGSPWTVNNFGGANYGSVSLLTATENSINTAYAQLNINVGPEKLKDVAIRAGLPENTQGLDTNAANVLGTASPTTEQMASAFSTFAAQGVYRAPHMVRSVTDPQGETLYKPDTKGERKFDKDIMAETTYALSRVVTSGSGSYASNLGRPAAGKTGTSTDSYSAWFVGYTPELSTAVSIFRTTPEGHPTEIGSYGGRGEVTGGSFPVQVWTEYMTLALDGTDVQEFPKRPDLPVVDKPENKSGASRGYSRSSSSGSSNSSRQRSQQTDEKPRMGATEEPEEKSDPKSDGGGGSKDAPASPKAPEPKAPAPQEPQPKAPAPKKSSSGSQKSGTGKSDTELRRKAGDADGASG